MAAYTLVEGAENGYGNVTVVSSPGYSVITTDLAASGTHSFNLAHSGGLAVYAISRQRNLGIDVERIQPESRDL